MVAFEGSKVPRGLEQLGRVENQSTTRTTGSTSTATSWRVSLLVRIVAVRLRDVEAGQLVPEVAVHPLLVVPPALAGLVLVELAALVALVLVVLDVLVVLVVVSFFRIFIFVRLSSAFSGFHGMQRCT